MHDDPSSSPGFVPFMKSYTIVGYAYEGELHCPGHKPDVPDDECSPVSADQAQDDDYCAECLADCIRKGYPTDWSYLL